MAGVEVENVVKRYGDHAVVHGVSVDIEDGEFAVLVGPSGCGKTTLLRMIAGLEEISEGEVRINGRVVNDVPSKSRDIAMVFQNYALYPHMTVADNMGFALMLAGVAKAEVSRKVGDAAAILGLAPLLDRFPRQLSGGQRQRVAMGRAIVRDPQVFLFDEPLSNLDAKLRVTMRSEIRLLQQRLSTTTIYVTHDQIEAMTMADKIVAMKDGRVEQVGSPLDLYDRPANVFVAGFIGSPSMNLLTGRIVEGAFQAGGGSRWPLPPGARVTDGQACLFGIRPEHLRLRPEGDGLKAEIVVLEPTGAETQAHLRFGSDMVLGAFRERLDQPPGSALWLAPEERRVHLFDPGTSQRL